MSTALDSVSLDKQYEQISSRVAAVWSANYNGFKIYLQIFSAILGGSIWLKLQIVQNSTIQKTVGTDIDRFAKLSDALVLLLTAICIIVVADNVGTWWGWRRKLATITAKSAVPDQLQNPFWAFALEVILCVAMIGVTLVFIFNNPFTL